MKRKKMRFLMLLLMALGTASVNAQVTIGSDADPHPGAVLDLQSTKGLLLPNVSLGNVADFELADPTTALSARGMMVFNYNDATIGGRGKGIYVWDGRWYDIGCAIPAPTVTAVQAFCSGATVANLAATGTTIQWYSAATGGTPLVSTTVLADGTKYYASQTFNCCESTSRAEVTVTINTPLLDVERNKYCYGSFGSAGTWMTENLRVTKYSDGTALTYDNSTTNYEVDAKYYTYPNNDSENVNTLGLLYTWAAATNRTGNLYVEEAGSTQPGVQGICPAGWHVPSNQEWFKLEQEISESDAGVYSTTGAIPWVSGYNSCMQCPTHVAKYAVKLKSTVATANFETNGTSLSYLSGGFDAALAGRIAPRYNDYGKRAYFWTASTVWACACAYDHVYVYDDGFMPWSYEDKYDFMSVRCKQD